MARKNPETAVVPGFFEPISFSVRIVGCGGRTWTYDLRVMSCCQGKNPLLSGALWHFCIHFSGNPEGQSSIPDYFLHLLLSPYGSKHGSVKREQLKSFINNCFFEVYQLTLWNGFFVGKHIEGLCWKIIKKGCWLRKKLHTKAMTICRWCWLCRR